MKKPLGAVTAAAIVAVLMGLIGNMISEEVEAWLSKALGPSYLVYLLVALVVLVAVSVWLNLSSKSSDTGGIAPTERKGMDEQAPPALRGPSPAEYQKIEQLAKASKFKQAFTAIQKVPALREDCKLLQTRFSEYHRKFNEGTLSNEQLTTEFNQLAKAFWSFLSSWKPTALVEESVEAQVVRDRSFYALTSADHPLLKGETHFLGREPETKEMIKLLQEQQHTAYTVIGEGGLGKTDFCRQVLWGYMRENADTKVFWLNIEGMESAAELQASLANIAGLPEESSLANIQASLQNLGATLFYLDNLESITWQDKFSETQQLLMQLQHISDMHWLASSRDRRRIWEAYPLPELDLISSQALFVQEWTKSGALPLPEPLPTGLEQFIAEDLGKHPLSIVLTASQAIYYPSYEDVIADWKAGKAGVSQRRGWQKNRTTSLDYSIQLSMQRVKQNRNALRMWALCAFFPRGIDVETERILLQEQIITPADTAILLQNCILRRTDGGLTLLPPVSRFVFQQLQSTESVFSEQQILDDVLALMEIGGPVDYLTNASLSWRRRVPLYLRCLEYFIPKLKRYASALSIDDRLFNFF